MSLVSLGDMAQSFMLRRHMGQVKADLALHTQEMTTGLTTDIARRTDGDLGPLNAISASLARLETLASVTSEMQLWSGAMQSALEAIDNRAIELGPQLLSAASARQPATFAAVSGEGEAAFLAAVGYLNTSLDGRALFGGVATDHSPLPDSASLLNQVAEVAQGATSVADLRDRLDTWFGPGGGFETAAWRGGAALEPVTIAQGETARLTPTALSDGIRDTLKGLALAALAGRDLPGPGIEDKAAMLAAAGDTLIGSSGARAALSADLGITEQRIADAQTRNAAEMTALKFAESQIRAADPFEAASRVQEAETQLQLIYTLTARLSGLSLADYLG
ncbi:flagellin [Gemmobacter sp. LW-1]|jgi:flagellar hook-associated protein 3 FlgL|uniref:flagellin n=1 Tax=Gemmobacter sp. LW-1 TaxID=1529005 RepID=UPI000961DC5D|nr:flagellin [Gemmobacter sp. LW-1]OJY34433.1 MAG: hypothetical protein BGP11_17500 [Rhodobacterales bacterium 65-51]